MERKNFDTIFIVSANIGDKDLCRVIKKIGNFKWVYFGKYTPQYYKIKKFISPFAESINSGEIINRIARDIKDEFVNLDKSFDLGSNSYFWYATDIAERNPYASDFFYNCCTLIALEEIINKENNNLIIFIEDLHLSRLIKKRIGKSVPKIKVFWHFSPFMFSMATMILSVIYDLYLCLRAAYQRIRFFVVWLRRRAILAKYNKNIGRGHVFPEVLLTLWTDASTFKNKKYLHKETYFGPLASYIQNSGKNLGYIAFPLVWISKYKDIVKSAADSGELVIFPEQCLNLFNVLHIIIYSLFYTPKLKTPLMLSGIDIGSLFFNEIKKEKTKRAHLRNLTFYFIGKYLFARKISPKKIISLYENQSWEKLLKLGINKYFKQTEFIGYQHAPFPKLYLNYFPSRRDINSSKLPDRIITIGKIHEDIFLEHKYPKLTLCQGPALRFDYLFKRGNTFQEDTSSPLPDEFILVVGSISYWESFELVYKVIGTFKDRPEHSIRIKLHPKMDKGQKLIMLVLKQFNTQVLPTHIKFLNDSMKNILPKAKVLFYSETTVSYEAVALNIPVVFFRSDIWLDMDELEWFGGAFYRVGTSSEILEVLSKIDNSRAINSKESQLSSEAVVSKSFNTFSTELIKNFYC
ncbi:MAG: hypothetical protein ABIH71_03115 [Candidatus Omnitrophota bacterium]